MTSTVFEISLLWDYPTVDGDMSVNEALMCLLLSTEQDRAKCRVTPHGVCRSPCLVVLAVEPEGESTVKQALILSCIRVHIL